MLCSSCGDTMEGVRKKRATKPLETGKSGEKGVHLKNIYFSAVTCRLRGWENPAWHIQKIVAQATMEIIVMHQKSMKKPCRKSSALRFCAVLKRGEMLRPVLSTVTWRVHFRKMLFEKYSQNLPEPWKSWWILTQWWKRILFCLHSLLSAGTVSLGRQICAWHQNVYVRFYRSLPWN